MKKIAWLLLTLSVTALCPADRWEVMTPALTTCQPGVCVTQRMEPLSGSNRFRVELQVTMDADLYAWQEEALYSDVLYLRSPIVHAPNKTPIDQSEANARLGKLYVPLCEDVHFQEANARYITRIRDDVLCWDVLSQMQQAHSTSVSTAFVIEIDAPAERYDDETGNIVQRQSTLVYAGARTEGAMQLYRLDLRAPKVRVR